MEDKTGWAAIKLFFVLKSKMFKTAFVAISNNKYKDILLNKKCLRHLMNRIQGEGHKIETCEINKIYLSCFHDRIYILNNGFDGSAIGY